MLRECYYKWKFLKFWKDYQEVGSRLVSEKKRLNGLDSSNLNISSLSPQQRALALDYLNAVYEVLKNEELHIIARFRASGDAMQFHIVNQYKLSIARLAVNYSSEARKTALEMIKTAEEAINYDLSLIERKIAEAEQKGL